MSITNEFTGIARICAHRIRWRYDLSDGTPDFTDELPESEEEHIRQCLNDGCVEGELCYYDAEQEMMFYGWWEIDRHNS
jgi:hypothetical protein